jgi:hypothetical protein
MIIGSTSADEVPRCTLARVSVARMATVKPHGWVHASLDRVRLGTFPRSGGNWIIMGLTTLIEGRPRSYGQSGSFSDSLEIVCTP